MRIRSAACLLALRRERTPQGIGPGSRKRLVRRVFPTIRCESLATNALPRQYVAHGPDCTLFGPRGTRTIFRTFVDDHYGITAAEYVRRAVVTEVIVAAR